MIDLYLCPGLDLADGRWAPARLGEPVHFLDSADTAADAGILAGLYAAGLHPEWGGGVVVALDHAGVAILWADVPQPEWVQNGAR